MDERLFPHKWRVLQADMARQASPQLRCCMTFLASSSGSFKTGASPWGAMDMIGEVYMCSGAQCGATMGSKKGGAAGHGSFTPSFRFRLAQAKSRADAWLTTAQGKL